jgi:hypothetical protein
VTTEDSQRGTPGREQGGSVPTGDSGAGRSRPALGDEARREALQRSGASDPSSPRARPGYGDDSSAGPVGQGTAAGSTEARTTVLPSGGDRRPERPSGRSELRGSGTARPGPARPATRPAGRGRRARLVLQRVDPWSVFLFSLVASICLGIVLLVAVAALYFVLANLGVLSSVNNVLGEVLGDAGPDEVAEPVFTASRVLGATAVLAAVDVVLLTVLATLSALLYNLCASLTGGIEVVLGERD